MEPNSIGQAGFYPLHRVGLLLLSLLLVLSVLELVRRGHLKERYALLWLAVSACGLFIGAFPNTIVWFAQVLGFQYLTVVSMFAFLFLLLLVLTFTVIISKLSEHNRELAQEIALLNQRMQQIETENHSRRS